MLALKVSWIQTSFHSSTFTSNIFTARFESFKLLPILLHFQMFAFASQSGGKFVGAQGESGDIVQPAHHFLFNRFLEFYPWTFFLQNTSNISLLLSEPCFVLWMSFIELTWIPSYKKPEISSFFLKWYFEYSSGKLFLWCFVCLAAVKNERILCWKQLLNSTQYCQWLNIT